MLIVVGLTKLGERVAQNPHNGNTADYRVLAYLYSNNNQANRDSICQRIFGGDESSCNAVLGSLKKQHLIAYEM